MQNKFIGFYQSSKLFYSIFNLYSSNETLIGKGFAEFFLQIKNKNYYCNSLKHFISLAFRFVGIENQADVHCR